MRRSLVISCEPSGLSRRLAAIIHRRSRAHCQPQSHGPILARLPKCARPLPPGPSMTASTKQPFDVDTAIRRIREAMKPYPKAALFELAAEGHDSVFEVLVACIISIRTYDEVTLPTARRL